MGEWSNLEELVAIAVEVIDQGNRQFHAAHSKKGARAPKPLRIPRPPRPRRKGEPEPEEERKKRPATSEELRAFFGGGIRYTGPKGRPRCPRGHFVRDGEACARCGNADADT